MPATKALITILESVMEYAGETQELTESEKGTIVKICMRYAQLWTGIHTD